MKHIRKEKVCYIGYNGIISKSVCIVQASVSRASTTKRPLPTESVQPTKRQKQNTVSTKQTSTPKRTKPSTNVTRPSNVGGVRATKRNVEPLKERRTSIRIAEKKAEQKVVPEAHLEGKGILYRIQWDNI
jgi:hypothetical protein